MREPNLLLGDPWLQCDRVEGVPRCSAVRTNQPADTKLRATEIAGDDDGDVEQIATGQLRQDGCLLYTSPSPRDRG